MQITKENLTIVIVTIKSEKVIEKCLNSIDPQIKKIIIENSSDENFIRKLKSRYKNIDCYISGKNLGMGAGNNIGIKKSKTRYVMILNPDTLLKNDTLDQIFKISKMLDFAILSPISDNINYPNFKIHKNTNNLRKDLFEVDQVDGYSMVIDKLKFNEDYFDENIFMYLENDDLCLRMKKRKEKVYIFRKSLINHLGAKAVDDAFFHEVEFSRNWHWNWSKFYFKKKHYGFIFAFITEFPNFIRSCLKCIFYYLLKNKFKFKIYFCRASGFFNSLMNKNSSYRPRFD
jgi:N-acetylglucosaminyl-diphospho-decaprenol L-rhamnosyltransferase